MAVDRSGNAITAGTRLMSGSRSVYVSKHSTSGSLLWELHPDAIAGEARAIATAPGGNVYVVGSEAQDQDRTTVLAACLSGVDGRLLWRSTVSPPNVGGSVLEGSADACAVGPRGELVVGGYVRTDNGTSAIVARLAPGDGNSVWTWAAAQTTVTALGIDRRGDVLATGSFMVAAKLRGTDGAVQWRINSPAPKFEERGYPQLRSLALDSKGNVSVGGSLRNVLEDTRSFYVTTLASSNGRRLSEDAGPALYSYEAAARVHVSGADVYAAGRLNGEPRVLRFRGNGGFAKWGQRPWSLDEAPDRTLGVADLAVSAGDVYALGTDFPGRLLVTMFNAAGKQRWNRDLGPGRGVRILVSGRRLLVLGTVTSEESERSVLHGLEPKSGTSRS